MTTDSRFDGPGPDSRWQAALAEGRFLIQRCAPCGAAQFPPSLACRSCGAPAPAMIEASGRGTIYSTTTVRKRDGSHNVSIIDLAEGARMMSRVEGDPDRVRIGQPVAARIVTTEDGAPLVVFDIVGAAK